MDILKNISLSNPVPDTAYDEYAEIFENAIADPRRSLDLYQQLHTLFVDVDFDSTVVATHYRTYWKWYVMATWENLHTISREEFLLIYPRQWMTACYLGKAVKDDMLFSLYEKSKNVSDVQLMYVEIRGDILSSTIPCVGDTSYTVQQFINDVKKLNLTDNLVRAESMQQMERKMFSVDRTFFEYDDSQKTEILGHLLVVVDLFVAVDKIFAVYEEYITSFLGDHEDEGIDDVEQISSEDMVDASSDVPVIDEVSSEQLFENPSISYPHIRQTLETEFIYDDTDTLSPLEDVLQRLEELSHEYNDPQIQDLYYFDEGEGKFVWNEELLH